MANNKDINSIQTVEDWLGTDNKFAISAWKEKYQHNNETFLEWLDRITNYDDELRKEILNKRFLFGGRILANRGLQHQEKKVSFSNCYVVTAPEDNIESIFNCASNLARTYSYGGGCGIDISKLAPKGAKVNNAAKTTTGAVSFMELYNLVTSLICQEGRRGALMLSISCDHPDLEEFIDIKSDLNKINKANLSIRVTDEFMLAVQNDTDYELKFERPETDEIITKTVRAKKIFEKFVYMCWDYAEPAFLYWDSVENWNLMSNNPNFKYGGTNPCFTGDMKLLTKYGYKTFEELCNTTPQIINVDGNITTSKIWCNGEKNTIRLTLSDKNIITCTPNHKFMTIDGYEIEAKDSKGIKLMPHLYSNNTYDKQYVKYGFIQGDGQLSRLKSDIHNGIEVNIGFKDGDIYDLFSDETFTIKSKREIYLLNYICKLKELGFSNNNTSERTFPATYHQWNLIQKASFLNGCYSANGCIVKHHRISYKTTSKEFANELVLTLKRDFNINSYITTNKSKNINFANGTYKCKESYNIEISQYENIQIFNDKINFYQQYKRISLRNLLIERARTVINIKPNGIQKVYDFTEPERHWGVVNGLIVHNCAEEPLPEGGSCLLGSINLSAFIKNEFTENAYFDFEQFTKSVPIYVDAMNDVLIEGLPLHPLQEQRDTVDKWKQIGLGIMGLADMLIKLGIKYGSEEALNICDQIGEKMINCALCASAKIASVQGAFEEYTSQVLETPFFQHNASSFTKEYVSKHGLYNSQLLTIAPTGTISNLLGISGGIEPIFAYSYQRKTESLHNKEEYYTMYTSIVKDYMEKHNLKTVDELPDYFVTAEEIPYMNRIEMQATWQTYIDASISSTVNLPKETTQEEVANLYMYAWEKNLKGITVYRAGGKRDPVLSTENKTENTESNNEIESDTKTNKESSIKVEVSMEDIDEKIPLKFKRGMIESVPRKNLKYRNYKLQTGCGSLYLFVGVDEDDYKIYDIFTNTDGSGGCTINTQANSRLISACMRGGIDIDYIIEQLEKSGTCPSYQFKRGKGEKLSKGKSCPSAIANVLKKIQKELEELRKFDEMTGCDDTEDTFDWENYKVDMSNQINKTGYILTPMEIQPLDSTEIINISTDIVPPENVGTALQKIAHPLKNIDKDTSEPLKSNTKNEYLSKCPSCGANTLVYEGGCNICKLCGWSKCD